MIADDPRVRESPGKRGSVERAGGEHEARRGPWLGPAAGVKARAVQAVAGLCLHGGLGFPAVGEDPRHDRLRVSTRGHDRGPLDHGAAAGVSSGQASEQRPDRVVIHPHHGSPRSRIVSRAGCHARCAPGGRKRSVEGSQRDVRGRRVALCCLLAIATVRELPPIESSPKRRLRWSSNSMPRSSLDGARLRGIRQFSRGNIGGDGCGDG